MLRRLATALRYRLLAGVVLLAALSYYAPLPAQGADHRSDPPDEGTTGKPARVSFTLKEIVPEDVALSEAKHRLLLRTRREAVEKAIGTDFRVSSLFVDQMSQIGDAFEQNISSSNFVHSIAHGQITDEKVEFTVENVSNSTIEIGLAYSAGVRRAKGRRDPGFKVTCMSPRSVFQDGEEIELSVNATKDCYISIFNLAADDRVYLLFPNEASRDNRVPAGSIKEIPDRSMKERGIGIVLHPLPDRKVTSEMILVVATLQPIPFPEKGVQRISGFGEVGNSRVAWIGFQRWLAPIPLEERAEANIVYQVLKGTERGSSPPGALP